MARITVEDCLVKENNRFALVQLAAKRAKQLLHGGKTVITETKGNKAVVNALREIADGKVCFMTEEEVAQAREQARLEKEKAAAEEQQAQANTERNRLFPARPEVLAASDDDDDDDDDDGADIDDEEDDDDEDDDAEEGKDKKDLGSDEDKSDA
jgi:DNA-directed RNA polymerase subunit omega